MTPVDPDRSVLDLLDLEGQFSGSELEFRDQIRALVDSRIRPNIAQWFDDAYFPRDLVPALGAAGMLGTQLVGYQCPGRSAVEYGLGVMELEAGDSGIRTFVSVQGSLAMSAIHKWGSEEQKSEFLPKMARGELIGCFGLTEETAGSDPSAMLTTATRTSDGWVIDGNKRWIGMASIADIAIIWARTPDGIRGFVVSTDTPGFSATPISSKLSMRASIQCDVVLRDIHVPADAVLPGATGLRAALACLTEARYGIIWGAMGAARDSLEDATRYALARTQFGRVLAGFQLTQEKLTNMLIDVQRGTLLAIHLGRLKDAGELTAAQVSFGKLSNVRDAIAVCRTARTVFGGNGISLDHSALRHANNLESVRTYEGTDEVHTLIVGEAMTGISAFR
ncbi:MAG: acyl-CoA dehydrogenase family protein [Actinomycetota bacterium]|nr:acyl-CoA dehydrogenase family protein [Actinomycetota bacterium]